MEAQPGRGRSSPSKTTSPAETAAPSVMGNEPSSEGTFRPTTERDAPSGRPEASRQPQSGEKRGANGGRGWGGVLRDAASDRLSTQKHRASEGIDGVAQALRETTGRLNEKGHASVADYAEQAADRLEQFSRRLEEQDLDEVLRSAQRFARSQPWVFIGAAFGVGLFAARFFKSSSERRDVGWQSQGGTLYSPPMATTDYRTADVGTGPAI